MQNKLRNVCIGLVVLLGLATQSFGWGWKSAQTPQDVKQFLSGEGAYPTGVTDAKISASIKNGKTEFTVFYTTHPHAGTAGSWAWKYSNSASDVKNLLNGAGAYNYPVKRARICAIKKGNRMEYVVFYQSGNNSTSAGWTWKLATTPDDAVHYLNGKGAYKQARKEAEIVSVKQKTKTYFYIFSRKGPKTQLHDTWSYQQYSNATNVKNAINGPLNYPIPKKDNKVISSCDNQGLKYYVFRPQGYLIITRDMFVNELDAYIEWKQNHGFDVMVMTAEWMNRSISGTDIRNRMRKAIRSMYNNAKVNYALLIGDSVDVITAPDGEVYQEPPVPHLNEPWSLPAGYYQWEVWNSPQYTTLYYSDLNDKTYYPKTEHYWDGNYKIYVGVLPVRTTEELTNYLDKTMAYQKSKTFTFVYSSDLYTDTTQTSYNAIKSIIHGAGCSVTRYVYNENIAAATIYNKLFEKQGIIYENGHGNVGIFRIGSTVINNDDYIRFDQINPLLIASSCSVQAYHLGESLDEAFIKGPKGPAAISTAPPWGSKPQGVALSDQTKGYWENLVAGKSIGQAFYDNCHSTWHNPLHLFGDPSLAIVGE